MAGDTLVLERTRMPKRHWECTLDSIPDSCPHKKFIVSWIDNIVENVKKARGLLLMGEYSTGKSGIAAIIMKTAALNGIIGLWIRAREIPKFIIEKTVFDEELTMMERAEKVPLLVIDELQIRADVAYTEQTVEALVRWRIDNKLCTILTTNHSKDDLRMKYRALTEALTEAVKPAIVSGHNFRTDRMDEWQV